jgi:NADH:ubiquinone oxidoreductase subunit H
MAKARPIPLDAPVIMASVLEISMFLFFIIMSVKVYQFFIIGWNVINKKVNMGLGRSLNKPLSS